MEKLAGDTNYTAAVKEAGAAEAVVKQYREGGHEGELATASQKWMTAKNRVEGLKNDAIAADPVASAAKAELVKQQGVIRGLRNAFEEQLKTMPQMLEATQKLTAAQTALTSANAEIKKLETDLATANKQIAQKKTLLANGQKMIAAGSEKIRREEQDLRQADNDVTNLARDLQTRATRRSRRGRIGIGRCSG